ncbi:carbohydrate ABC transporter membrane protein 2 (CUT1 family) [Mobilisporobacter senegalensis]|uniref:Carbohydrate ABC transporter membrane protein 2 (CUT1 family) n=1 Tax=Mobilisporobacter senegalensis TaxID=1329262 RepID=A0A3N1XRP2_9FIRM|nr:carbohydrate ABC transporter permease [Mobilisporobacter senegalensis]ROR29306.1 carbohydrate ABC transporter membrane protein 2 (CUT1 family) [Mobilisporobacter senegalensis]
MNNKKRENKFQPLLISQRTIRYIVCIFLCILSILPFWIMLVNSTRTSVAIQQGISLIPSDHLINNLTNFLSEYKNVWLNMGNSAFISIISTGLCVYASSMVAYGLTVYKFKGRNFAWSFILAVMMVPAQVSAIGFFRFMQQLGLLNTYIPLILPAIAAPSVVFFMKQFMKNGLPLEIVDAARIDGSGEINTFNRIALPLLKPAIATQAIFAFIASWNNYFTPAMIISEEKRYTLPMLIAKIKDVDPSNFDLGRTYVGLTLTVIPIFIVYFALSKYIIAGVALGGVKE